jgi:transposase
MGMEAAVSPLPDDVAALKALLNAATRRADEAEARLANAKARESATEAMIAHLKLQIAKLKREAYGASAERSKRLLAQMELQLEDLEADASEDELVTEAAAAKALTVTAFERKRPSRKPFPDHLPRERIVVPAPCSCPACGSSRLAKLGEDITETLEVIPRSWKVTQTVREKFSCRDCEKIAQAPAPFHVLPRGWAGPSFLAMLLFEKYGQHQPLNRQAERFAREGVPLSTSTLADQVGGGARADADLSPDRGPCPRRRAIARRRHDRAGSRQGQDRYRRLWVYVRDDKPFGGADPPARCSTTRATGAASIRAPISYPGQASCRPTPMADMASSIATTASPVPSSKPACFAHARRKFFELADVEGAARKKSRGERAGMIYPIALEAVQRLDALFDIERGERLQAPPSASPPARNTARR